MPGTIFVVRHGQGEHNVTNDWNISDPVLTSKGKEQCMELQRNFENHDEIDLVISSPLRRALQTTVIAFSPILARPEVPALLLPLAQEIGDAGCDTGLEPLELRDNVQVLFKDEPLSFKAEIRLDFSDVNDGWNTKISYWAYNRDAVTQRAGDLRNWLFQRPERNILVVMHGAFMHFLTEDWSVDDPMESTSFKNCEVRRYKFTEGSTAEDARLQETPASERAGAANTLEDIAHVSEDVEIVADKAGPTLEAEQCGLVTMIHKI